MALPLKSGADLYNNQALRLRLHNLGADPTEVGAGLIYFNTSTGLNTSHKARLYTGSAWKTIAFSEDLDVASNADFLALKERVDLLSGDVDTDAIISNMKEVSAFLEGFAENANLMDYLNTELGKKLDKTGGTINGNLAVSSGTISSLRTSTRRAVFYKNASESVDSGTYIVDVSDSGDAVLKLTYNDLTWKGNTLIHEGNVGEHNAGSANMLAYLTASANADMNTDLLKGGIARSYSEGMSKQFVNAPADSSYGCVLQFSSYPETVALSGQLAWDINHGSTTDVTRNLWWRVADNKNGFAYAKWHQIAFTDSNVAGAYKLVTSAGEDAATVGNDKIVTFGTHVRYNICYFRNVDGGFKSWFGRGSTASDDITLYISTENSFKVYTNSAQRMLINSSGNVTIGGSDLASTTSKLSVDGGITLTSLVTTGTITKIKELGNKGLYVANSAKRDGYGVAMWVESNGYGHIQAQGYTDESKTYPLTLNRFGGNVLIGTSTDDNSDARLQVNGCISASATTPTERYFIAANSSRSISLRAGTASVGLYADKASKWMMYMLDNGEVRIPNTTKITGDLHVSGNIIADGEVSAGGAAEEGGNAGGGGAFHSDIIKEGATQTTIAHGLGTDDIVVSIYEKDGVSGRWSIILTDVEIVDANNIIVSFGSATTVEHKVVIMGAVA